GPGHGVGWGARRPLAAAAVAGGPRVGARAARPDMQPAVFVTPRERAAAGADLDDIDYGELHRLAGEFVADHVAFGDRRDSYGDQRGLGGGAAHVEADRLCGAELPGRMARPAHPRP